MKIALIHWKDAYFQPGEISSADLNHNHLNLFSAGILVEKTDEAIKIATDFCPETEEPFRELAVIPTEYVISAIILDIDSFIPPKKPKKRKKV